LLHEGDFLSSIRINPSLHFPVSVLYCSTLIPQILSYRTKLSAIHSDRTVTIMASTYKLADYDSDAERKKIPQRPPRENLLAAATFITLLLARNNIDYATMGGFAMICRGSTRNTTDVDIIVDTSFARLWDVLQKQPR
jgi:hypothetical protein